MKTGISDLNFIPRASYAPPIPDTMNRSPEQPRPVKRGSAALFCPSEKSRLGPRNRYIGERLGDYALINAPDPITTICKDGFIASISSLYVFLIDKGDRAGAHPYNRVLARA